MKKIFLFAFIFLTACSAQPPQVTVTSEVTATLTPPPTPTLHPQFIALQEQIAAYGTRFTLNADGVYDGANPIPGLIVSPTGEMTIMVDGQPVILDPAKTHFDDVMGFTNDEYVYDESTGEYKPAAPPIEFTEAGKATMAILEQLNVPDSVVKLEMRGESVVCIDVATGAIVCKDGKFTSAAAEKYATEYGDPINTPYGPAIGNYAPGTDTADVTKFVTVPLLQRARKENKTSNQPMEMGESGTGQFKAVMLSEKNKSWGIQFFVDRKNPSAPMYFIFENSQKELVIIPLN